MKRYLNPWLHPDIVFFNTEDGKRMKTSDEKIDKNVIEVRKLYDITNMFLKICF